MLAGPLVLAPRSNARSKSRQSDPDHPAISSCGLGDSTVATRFCFCKRRYCTLSSPSSSSSTLAVVEFVACTRRSFPRLTARPRTSKDPALDPYSNSITRCTRIHDDEVPGIPPTHIQPHADAHLALPPSAFSFTTTRIQLHHDPQSASTRCVHNSASTRRVFNVCPTRIQLPFHSLPPASLVQHPRRVARAAPASLVS
ncbi:hypothetical protein BD626DRAFT_208557 [Schizophyllum amplum]|uniref:Uncharacterized protein n=1 Tax=Schizophyllum amplum TaxID=97359 RepID=A0A550BYZ2_9AGAR|nr:hypothetical protein BD626DRAFT_208557 [Auriculariopsis ampla]